MEDFRKAFESTIDDIDVKKREVIAIISTDGLDRDGEVLLPKGLRKKNYAGMTIDFNHDKDTPVGVSCWVKSEPNRVISKYRVSDKTDFARDVFSLIQDGVLRFHSVDGKAFSASKPTTDECRINKAWGEAKRIIRDWEMFNFTVCTVPVNPDAVAMYVAKGYSPKTFEKFTATPPAVVVPAPQIIAPAPTITGPRSLTGGEVLVTFSKALGQSTSNLSAKAIVARCFNRAAGRLE